MPVSSKFIYTTAFLGLLTCLIFSVYIKKNRNLPILIWWTPLMVDNERKITCFDTFSCVLTNQRHYDIPNIDAYLFYGSQLQHHDVPLPRDAKMWAIFHEESPKNLASFLDDDTQSLFNITATFSRYSNFPLTLQYLDYIDDITDNRYYIGIKEKNNYLKELAPILYIQSNCDTPVQRDKIVTELMKYIEIDSYGACLNNKQLPGELIDVDPLDYYNEAVMHLIAKYKFTLALENAICEDYITEKLWRPLIAGSVPIYLGSPSIEDWLPNNSSAILIKHYESLKDLAAYIKTINDRDDFYENYMEHKVHKRIKNSRLINEIRKETYHDRQSDADSILAFECFVCKAIHENNFQTEFQDRSIYECPRPDGSESKNPWISHWKIGKCQSRAFRDLIETDKKFTKEEFDKAWLLLYENEQC